MVTITLEPTKIDAFLERIRYGESRFYVDGRISWKDRPLLLAWVNFGKISNTVKSCILFVLYLSREAQRRRLNPSRRPAITCRLFVGDNKTT